MKNLLARSISKIEHGIHIVLTLLTGGGWLLVYVLRIFLFKKNQNPELASKKSAIMNRVEKLNASQPASTGVGNYEKRTFDSEDDALEDDWYDYAEPYTFEIVGESYKRDNLMKIIEKNKAFRLGEIEVEAVLKLEPNNKFDSTAVAVFIENKAVGYVPSDYSLDVTSYLDDRNLSGIKVKAKIGWDKSNPDPAIGVKLDFNF